MPANTATMMQSPASPSVLIAANPGVCCPPKAGAGAVWKVKTWPATGISGGRVIPGGALRRKRRVRTLRISARTAQRIQQRGHIGGQVRGEFQPLTRHRMREAEAGRMQRLAGELCRRQRRFAQQFL